MKTEMIANRLTVIRIVSNSGKNILNPKAGPTSTLLSVWKDARMDKIFNQKLRTLPLFLFDIQFNGSVVLVIPTTKRRESIKFCGQNREKKGESRTR